jgi:hypothetical protein
MKQRREGQLERGWVAIEMGRGKELLRKQKIIFVPYMSIV